MVLIKGDAVSGKAAGITPPCMHGNSRLESPPPCGQLVSLQGAYNRQAGPIQQLKATLSAPITSQLGLVPKAQSGHPHQALLPAVCIHVPQAATEGGLCLV